MAKQRKNSYRLRFTIGDKRPEYIAHTQSEANSVTLNVNKLISSKKTGVQNVDALEWAQKLPKGRLKDFLIRWGLLEDTADRERTIKDLLDHFQNWNAEQGTLDTFKYTGLNLVDFFGADKLLRDITPLDAGRFETFLSTAARRDNGKCGEEGLGKSTAKKRIQRVKQFFKEAQRLKWIDEDPFAGIHGGNIPNKEKWVYVSKEDTLAVMENTPNLQIRARIALCRYAGARGKSEFDSLEWNSDWIRWSEDGKPGEIRLYREKTKDSGYINSFIPMVPALENALRDLYDSAEPGTVKVFSSRANPGVMIKKQFIRNGIDIITPYNLRRGFCRDIMESGVDPKAYEVFCGHSFATGMKWYQTWDDVRANKNAPKILEALSRLDLAEKTTPPICPQLPPKNAPSSISQYLTGTNGNNGLSLKNKEYYEMKKAPASSCEGYKLGNRDLNPD